MSLVPMQVTGVPAGTLYRADQAEALARMGSWQYDISSEVMQTSPGMRAHLGLGPQDDAPTLPGYLHVVHPEDREQVAADWAALAKSGRGFEREHRLVLPGGELKYMHAVGAAERDGQGHLVSAYGMTQDITALRLSAVEVEQERDLTRTILASLYEGYLLTHGGVILEVNDALCRMTGFCDTELVGHGTPYPFWPSEDTATLLVTRAEMVADQGGQREIRLARKDGTVFDAQMRATPLPDTALSSEVWVVVVRDVTTERAYERALLQRAESDPLTGLRNSRSFRADLRGAAHTRPLSLALLDIDHFKLINDTHGHAVGDAVLVAFADCLRSCTPVGYFLARVGGEEFTVLMPDTTEDQARAFIRTLLDRIRTTPMPHGTITASAGLAAVSAAMNDDDLFRLADSRLYLAKDRGRDQLC